MHRQSRSQYVVEGIEKGWAKRWRRNGWMRNKRERVVNPELWGKLLDLCEKHTESCSMRNQCLSKTF